jgi:hypothetical protein
MRNPKTGQRLKADLDSLGLLLAYCWLITGLLLAYSAPLSFEQCKSQFWMG